MADDLHITRAFNLLQEATVLLSGGIDPSSRDSTNINESTVSSTITSNGAVCTNLINTPTLNVSATSGPTPSCSNEFPPNIT